MENLTLVLMAGLPGTGKSTLAHALGIYPGWHVIDKDEFKAMLLREGLDHETASRLAYQMSFDVARDMLIQHQTSVILDSAVLDSVTLDNAMDLIRTFKTIQLKVILCVTSREQRIERAQNKFSRTNLNPTTRADYLQIFKHLPSDRLEIDTDGPLEDCLEIAREYLIGSPVAVSSSR